MTWHPRLVALDIDGTLVGPDDVLTDSMRQAVQRVRDAGVPVVLTTGRSWNATRWIFEALELPPTPVVLANGAVVASYPPFRIITQATLDPRPIIEAVLARAPHVAIAVANPEGGYRFNKPFPDGELAGPLTLNTLEQLVERPALFVIVRDPQATSEDFLVLSDQLGLRDVNSWVGINAWLNIGPAGVTKATGLAQAAAALGVARSDVLAIGDGRNDIDMFEWAGRGVCLGDAPDEVRRAADAVTGSFADGGTQAALDHYFG